jgi:hypothetical protein
MATQTSWRFSTVAEAQKVYRLAANGDASE